MYDSNISNISVMPMHGERLLPTFTLREIDLPAVKRWEVNSEYYLVLKVEMIGKNNRRNIGDPEDRQKVEGWFQVMSIKVLDDKPVDRKTLEQQAFEETVAKAKSGKYE